MILKSNIWFLEGSVGDVCVHMCTYVHGCPQDREGPLSAAHVVREILQEPEAQSPSGIPYSI